ncbi:NAD(P)-binding protein [Actinoplanes sp. NPDC049265]|uniref:NAD(P)-binding protein n=1 Tax=Actinoplanes sp. NPDC049265 TaxID=3363902 RepID=UPI00371B15FD
MSDATISTDYLVVGAGAAGMAFADSIVTHSDADVVLVDRRHGPGGHWIDAYPFVRLHSPSAIYGVNSRPLGQDAIIPDGLSAGLYEQATGAEICDYYDRVLNEQLIASGRVRFLGMHEYEADASGRHRLVSRLTGDTVDVTVNRKLVNAAYLENDIPATHTPSFQADPGVRLVPINALARLSEPPSGYTVIGAGKTGIDAVLWLLGNQVDPDRIRWIMPRDPLLLDRAGFQPLDQVPSLMDAVSREIEAIARATSMDDLVRRLETHGRMLTFDPAVPPTMWHCATVSRRELVQLRRVRDVVRLGHVRHIGSGEVTLDHGTIDSDAGQLYVDCSAGGLNRAPAKPIFEADRITVQLVRTCQPAFSAALVGFVETVREDDAAKNRLCPVNPYPRTPHDWLRGTAVTLTAARVWAENPDVQEWVDSSRLNYLKDVARHAGEPSMVEATRRQKEFLKPAVNRIPELLGEIGQP